MLPRRRSPSPLPTARLVERRHRLADLPAPPLDLHLDRVAALGRSVVVGMIALWPITAVVALAAALVVSAGA